jgi:hypothetical protein
MVAFVAPYADARDGKFRNSATPEMKAGLGVERTLCPTVKQTSRDMIAFFLFTLLLALHVVAQGCQGIETRLVNPADKALNDDLGSWT